MEEWRNLWNTEQREHNTWVYHREMIAEVSQYFKMSFSRRRGLYFVLTSVGCMDGTSTAELKFTWDIFYLQWRCRRADAHFDLREKGHFSFATNRFWISREESTRRIPDALSWHLQYFWQFNARLLGFQNVSDRKLSQSATLFWSLTYRRRM